MSWINRLASTIKLTSPDGVEFIAKWRGNDRSKSKKLGVFDYPKVKKQIFQDLEINSSSYPLTIFFDGDDNDIVADSFYSACDQKGLWVVIHPVVGSLSLQLASVTDAIKPLENGNFRVFECEFFEPAVESAALTNVEISALVENGVNDSNSSSSGGFSNKIRITSAAARTAISTTTSKITTAVNTFLGPLYTLSTEATNLVNSIQRGIQDTLDATVLRPLMLAAQIQQLIQTPALIKRDIRTRLNFYENFAQGIFGITPTTDDDAGLGIAAVKEVAAVSILGAVASIVVNSDITSREEAIESINIISALFDSVTRNLDVDQDFFINSNIENQYFSQSDSFNDNFILIANSQRLIFNEIVNLRIAKRFTLDRPRAPIEIAITEYGSLGDNDENFDLFLDTNNLKGDEIRLLPVGKEVLVYV